MTPYEVLKREKRNLTKQQYRTIKGQIKAGDTEGALKGIATAIRRNRRERTQCLQGFDAGTEKINKVFAK